MDARDVSAFTRVFDALCAGMTSRESRALVVKRGPVCRMVKGPENVSGPSFNLRPSAWVQVLRSKSRLTGIQANLIPVARLNRGRDRGIAP